MADSQFTCNCDVIHEDIVNDVKKKMQSKEEYIELASLFKLYKLFDKFFIKNAKYLLSFSILSLIIFYFRCLLFLFYLL